jgi:hypothetical protein
LAAVGLQYSITLKPKIMKNTFFIITTFIALAAFAQAPIQNSTALVTKDAKAQIKFESTVIDFGKIKKDIPVEKEFVFTNTGNAALIISSAHASCGCTTPVAPKDPILPGATGVIKAGFNARTLGPFSKQITVASNAEESSMMIIIKGEVVE